VSAVAQPWSASLPRSHTAPHPGAPRVPQDVRSHDARRTAIALGLALSLALHAAFVLWLSAVSLRGVAEERPVLRVAILSPPGGGSGSGGGPPAGPPPIPETAPAPVAPVAPVAPPKNAARKKAAAKPAPRAPVERALERPAAAPAQAAEVAAVQEGAAAAAGSAAGGGGDGSGSGRGSGRGSGGGTGGGSGAGSVLGAYLARVRQRIEGAKRYPMLARRTKLEGRAAVAFELDRSGAPRHVELRYADHPLLGEAALLAVRSASPFERLPDDLDDETLRVEVPLRFSLRDQ